MKINSVVFAGVMACIASFDAFATGENIVASKGYVDLKQDKIPETETRIANATVVETTPTDGVVTQRGIFDGKSVTSDNENHLVTVGTVADFAAAVEQIEVPNNGMECVDEPDCTLWRFTTGTASLVPNGTFAPLTGAACAAIGSTCTTDRDCCTNYCNTTLKPNVCRPASTTCDAYGATVSSASVCCSGVLQVMESTKCGCASHSDCASGQTCLKGGTCSGKL